MKLKMSAEGHPPVSAEQYSFCETVAAYRLHIRKLSDAGKKLSGGADTLTLCGMKPSWDTRVDLGILFSILYIDAGDICGKCRTQYLRAYAAPKSGPDRKESI